MTDKGNILAFPDTGAIDAEAAAWVARFDRGEVTASDHAAFQEWLHRSALHRQAIAEYGNLWSEFDELRLLTEAGDGGRQARENPAAVVARAWPWLAACAAAVIMVAGGVTVFHAKAPVPAVSRSRAPTPLIFETAVGGQRRITLADGSSAILNTNSRMYVNFTGQRRDIHLLRGEAYFEVVHNRARPFTVFANNYVVRDIGTAFNVQLSRAGVVEVGVTRGCVEVTADGSVSRTAKSFGVISAGHEIVLGQKARQAEVVAKADLTRKLAWRQGALIYTGQPLAEVLADVSRYSDIKIELADPALEKLPVGGAFRTNQIDAIFAALQENFGLRAEWMGPEHVRLSFAEQKAPSRAEAP